jgi:hypothetical protein
MPEARTRHPDTARHPIQAPTEKQEADLAYAIEQQRICAGKFAGTIPSEPHEVREGAELAICDWLLEELLIREEINGTDSTD